MTRFLFGVCTATSAGLFAWAFFTLQYPLLGVIAVLLGAGWIIGGYLRLTWISTAGLLALYALGLAGFFLGLSLAALLAGTICAFLAWDLADFTARLDQASPDDDIGSLERRHFIRLALVTVAGLILSLAVLRLRVRIPFEWMVVLMVIGILGTGRVMTRLLQKRD